MPANPKYLTQNKWQRFAKVSAAILGGFLVSAGTMLAIAGWSADPVPVFFTYAFFMFLQWCTLMLLAFLFKNGWNCWKLYGSITLVLAVVYFFSPHFHV